MLIGGIFVFFGLLLIAPPAWEYSNSVEFCGTTCHTMPPEYSLYLLSPHARVPCVDCHIGRDLILVQAFRKVGHLRLVAATVLDSYEYPIRTAEMRPARETCERCHAPEKFSEDTLRQIVRADDNRTNDLSSIYMVMHTGGGTEREGLGRGIHWHIENKITYIATDKDEQEIPWVRVQQPDGKIEDYVSINSPIDTQNLQNYTTREMDCTTCHNRVAHLIDSPTDAVDKVLNTGQMSTSIPFIRARAVEMLSEQYASTDEALQNIDTLDAYYRDNYPEFYANGREQVQTAIKVLKELYQVSNYPEQKLSWATHPDNVGHKDSPGCFRCHDGQHIGPENKIVRLECNLCHSIPQTVSVNDPKPVSLITSNIEPSSHLDSTWIARHYTVFDSTCANCHDVKNPGGTDNSSFCSNSQCHGVDWKYAGFNAPGLATILGISQVLPTPLLEDFTGDPTYEVLQPLFQQQCSSCHGTTPTKGLRVTDLDSLMKGSENGPVIVPGKPDESKIVKVLTEGHFAKLTDHQMALLRQWIANNAPAK
ncbi:MAG: NapC/NirT family cytochrome c [Anaerolineae bacterium]|nr:NapC/NirT family cytochrome c [Anaerolineae bacterium]